MKKLFAVLALGASTFLTGCIGTIETGNAGVRTAFNGEIQKNEERPGLYTAFFSSVGEFSAREIAVELNDMQPKAADNLSMQDMDVEVYYETDPNRIADLSMKYSGRNAYNDRLDIWYPAFTLVRSYARDAVYDAVSQYESLEIHKNRDALRKVIHDKVQKSLDASDPDVFKITKVIIRNAKTDPSVENAIKQNVEKDKILEAKEKEIQIALKQAKVNENLAASLTAEILEARRLDVMEKACTETNAKCTFFISTGEGGGSGVVPMYNAGR